MILKKTEKDNETVVLYSSSNILSSTYNNLNNDLTVCFKNGGLYKYYNVPRTDYTRFEIAESQGSVLNTHIKKYAVDKIGVLDSDTLYDLLNEIKTLNESENKVVSDKDLIVIMNEVINGYLKNNNITKNSLNLLSETLAELIKTK